jgi:methionine salvage enolase-phosphatase E1
MINTNKEVHRLYHEAKKRASKPQPLIKYKSKDSLLLSAPNNIIFELFNTIVKDVSAERLVEYIRANLKDYLKASWTDKITEVAVKRLKREQTVDVRAGLKEVPAIKFSTGHGQNETNQLVIDQVYNHIMWRVQTDNVSQITSLLIKLALDDGYKSGKLKVEAYDDVAGSFNDWRSKKLIKLYSFGSAPPNDQKLVLSSTTVGDLSKWVANYIDGSEKRQNPDLIRVLATALRDKTKNCIFITNDLNDATKSLETGAIRCALLADRFNRYEPIESIQDFSTRIEPLVTSGKLFIISSLDCVLFAPDPSNDSCC